MASESLRNRVLDTINQMVYQLATYRNKLAADEKPTSNAQTDRMEGVIALLQQIRDEVWPEAAPAAQHDAARYLPLLEQALQQLALDPAANGFQIVVQLKPGVGFMPVVIERMAPQVYEARASRKAREKEVRDEHRRIYGKVHSYNLSKAEIEYIKTGRV